MDFIKLYRGRRPSTPLGVLSLASALMIILMTGLVALSMAKIKIRTSRHWLVCYPSDFFVFLEIEGNRTYYGSDPDFREFMSKFKNGPKAGTPADPRDEATSIEWKVSLPYLPWLLPLLLGPFIWQRTG